MSRQSDCVRADGKPKWAYFTKDEAKKVARLTRERSAYQADSDIHVYRCPGCRYYHIGHEGGNAA